MLRGHNHEPVTENLLRVGESLIAVSPIIPTKNFLSDPTAGLMKFGLDRSRGNHVIRNIPELMKDPPLLALGNTMQKTEADGNVKCAIDHFRDTLCVTDPKVNVPNSGLVIFRPGDAKHVF